MSTTASKEKGLMPVMYFSHGSPYTICLDIDSTRFWRQVGQQAQAHGVKGICYISSHWTELDDRVRVCTNLKPKITQMDIVPKEHWENYKINVSPALGQRVVELLKSSGIPDVAEDSEADWHDDTVTPSKWMFPEGTPPATVVSLNARYDAVFHARVGRALRPLREEGILIIGSGATVHNMFRVNWGPVILRNDHLQPHTTAEKWSTDFQRAVVDVVSECSGPALPGALARLTKHPLYKKAHPSDDHFYPLLVIAGVMSSEEDDGVTAKEMAYDRELKNIHCSQFVWGEWPETSITELRA